jgi:hypothetical protein
MVVRQVENIIMISFMENSFIRETWFLWWMLAVVAIVRWLHVLQTPAAWERFDALDSAT